MVSGSLGNRPRKHVVMKFPIESIDFKELRREEKTV